MRGPSQIRQVIASIVLLSSAVVLSFRCVAAGVTIITHGLKGDVGGWIIPMADRILGANAICYEIAVRDDGSGGHYLTYAKLSGPALIDSSNAEIIIKLDWSDFATTTSLSTSSTDIANWVVPALLTTNGIPEFLGRTLVDFPVHLIGHSRGGSVVSELARLLGAQGVWVDHLTLLDPHPVSLYGDADVHLYSNVLFADDYYQDMDFFAYGEPATGAYNRHLTSLAGGYDDNHSNVHVWYHGTIDLLTPSSYYDVDDSRTIAITETMRQTWWNAYESRGAHAGFYYSLLGGGNRLSSDRPGGAGAPQIRDGVNQWWDFGAGTSNNRTALPSNNGNWPNIIEFNVAGTNLISFGQTNAVTIYVQWAKPSTSNATVNIYLDDDFNPYNGNERLLRQIITSGNGPNQIAFGTISIPINSANASSGVHALFAKMTGNGRSRYLYAPESLTIVSTFQPPILSIARYGEGQVHVQVQGVVGQRMVLSGTTDFNSWQALATNWMATTRWDFFDPINGQTHRFYQATVQ